MNEVHHSLLLYHHPELSISLGVTGVDMLAAKKTGRTGPASINFNGYSTPLRFLKAGNATMSFWEAPPIGDDFAAAAETEPCRLVGCRRIEDGEEIVVDGRHQSFVIEHAEGDILFFQAVARAGCAPVGVEYDSDTLQFIGASSTDEASSRLQMMVSLLRALGREDAFALLEEALASPQFFTRWHVMREMLAMDADAACRRCDGWRPAIRTPTSAPRRSRRWRCSSTATPDERRAKETWHAPRDRRPRPRSGSSSPSWSSGSRRAASTARTRTISPRGEPHLKQLANNRNFLADLMVAELKQRCEGQVRDNQYSAQVIMLHSASKNFIVRANFWPALKDSVIRHSGTDPFFYGVPHDHNFSFLTVGYFGPGYWSDYYEYEYDEVVGYPGEEVTSASSRSRGSIRAR